VRAWPFDTFRTTASLVRQFCSEQGA